MTVAGRRIARAAYSVLLRLVLPLYLLRVRWRGRAEPLYATAIGERIGRYGDAVPPGALWIHAVSLGETRAAAPLIDALRRARPDLRHVLPHGTATGRRRAAAPRRRRPPGVAAVGHAGRGAPLPPALCAGRRGADGD